VISASTKKLLHPWPLSARRSAYTGDRKLSWWRKYEIVTEYEREFDGFAQEAFCGKIGAKANDRA
jgi:hypothetical protein